MILKNWTTEQDVELNMKSENYLFNLIGVFILSEVFKMAGTSL
jgi:hypothetical protein